MALSKYAHPRAEMVEFLPDAAHSILDVGCSSGEFGRTLRAAHPKLNMVGVEAERSAAESAADVYDRVYTGYFPQCMDTLHAPEAKFDAVFFNDVLEHMPDAEPALNSARSLLNPGGVIIASIPNIRHISVLGQLAVQGDFRYRETGILDRTHLKFYTRRSMMRTFRDSGWNVDVIRGINRGLRVGDTKVPLWMRLLGRLTRGYSDDFFFVQYVVVASPEGVQQ